MTNEYNIHKGKFLLEIEADTQDIKAKSYKTNFDINCLLHKKFKFNSEFDQKGAKNFLKSKKIALQEIILDDSDISSDLTGSEEVKSKRKKELKNNQNIRVRKKKEEKLGISRKAKSRTNILVINKFNENSKNIKDNKNHKKNNLHHRFCSSHELKMFKNKAINKIKSIKKVHKDKFNSQHRTENLSFLEKNDSSIIDILTELD